MTNFHIRLPSSLRYSANAAPSLLHLIFSGRYPRISRSTFVPYARCACANISTLASLPAPWQSRFDRDHENEKHSQSDSAIGFKPTPTLGLKFLILISVCPSIDVSKLALPRLASAIYDECLLARNLLLPAASPPPPFHLMFPVLHRFFFLSIPLVGMPAAFLSAFPPYPPPLSFSCPVLR